MGSFHVGGGEVVEDEGVLVEVSACEALLDAGLAAEQPVHGVVELVLIDIAEAEEFSQGGDGGFGGEGACGGEFGAGVDDAGDDEGDGEIAVPAGGAGDEGVEPESPEGSEDGGDVPVGEAAAAGEGFVGGDEGFAFEDAAECFDGVIGEFGEVGEGSLFYFASVAEGLPEEDGGGRVPVRHAFDIHDY